MQSAYLVNIMAAKTLYRLIKPILINGIEMDSIEYRPLTVADLRLVNKSKTGNQVVRMLSIACGVSPEDVGNLKSRDLATLNKAVIGVWEGDDDEDEDSKEVFTPNDDDTIVVDLIHPVQPPEGDAVTSVTLEELTTNETIKAEKKAKGNSFEMIYNRVKASSKLDDSVLGLLTLEDYRRIQLALSVFFMPGEDPEPI